MSEDRLHVSGHELREMIRRAYGRYRVDADDTIDRKSCLLDALDSGQWDLIADEVNRQIEVNENVSRGELMSPFVVPP